MARKEIQKALRKYGIFDVRNGSVTCTELQKPTCHGEKWVCHGCSGVLC